MEDSTYAIFLIFGGLWVVMGAIAWVSILKLEGQPIRFGKWGLIVVLPIVIPLLLAFTIAALYH